MPFLEGLLLTTCCELLRGVFPDRLQHAEARLSTRALLGLHQAFVQQLRQLLEDRSLLINLLRGGTGSLEKADHLHRLQGEAAHKDSEAPEQLLLTCLQEIIAPGNRVP